jgi:hypothetical protein
MRTHRSEAVDHTTERKQGDKNVTHCCIYEKFTANMTLRDRVLKENMTLLTESHNRCALKRKEIKTCLLNPFKWPDCCINEKSKSLVGVRRSC